MRKSIAPQENQLKLPASWVARLLPRRGRPGKKRAPLADAETVARIGRERADRAEDLRAALDLVANESFADAGRAYLDGAVDPRGAAVVATLLFQPGERLGKPWLRPEFDAWVLEHGLPFAVSAAVERLAMKERTETYLSPPALRERVLVEFPTEDPDLIDHELDHDSIATVRSLLAAAADGEYAEVVAAVASHRDTPAKRIAAMILLPDEHAWVLEACADYMSTRKDGYSDDIMWLSITSAEQIAAIGIADVEDPWLGYNGVIALVDVLGTDALPILTGPAGTKSLSDRFTATVLEAIGLLPSDDAMAHLLERLDGPRTSAVAAKTADRFPLRALRVSSRLAATLPADRLPQLAAIAALPDAALRAHLTDTERAALDRLFADTGHVPEAAPEDLPPLLVTPPWNRKRPKAVYIEGLQPPTESHLVWTEGEQQAWSELPDPEDHENFWRTNFNEEPGLDAYQYRLPAYLAFGNIEKAEARLDDWKGDEFTAHGIERQRILGRYGERVIDRVLMFPVQDFPYLEVPGPVLNLTAARIAAEQLTRFKTAQAGARRWLDRHGLAAVPYLVPDALGSDKDRRKYAEAALAHLTTQLGTAAVAAWAEPYGPEAARAIRAWFGDDPLTPSVKVSKPGNWAVPSALPQVLLNGGERSLPVDSIPHLITVLALATPDYPYRGLEVVAETCDRESLTRFSLALFEQWLRGNSPAKDRWALTQLAHFADGATVGRLASLIREWPGENQHKRAAAGLEVLGEIGTEEAMRAVQGIADKVKFKALKDEAGRQITAIAERLGLSREQLGDRLVPDFGLGEQLVLDYGPRKFTVVFDERLVPSVTDETGKHYKTLPKPGVKDDAETAEAAYARYASFKKELRTVAADQVRRLEAAMVAARTWTKDEFEQYFVAHPLTSHLTRRLVWSTEIEGAHAGFRVAEDRTYTNAHDDALELPGCAVIRLDHPILMGERVSDWAELFADYEILQPFDQLGRPVMQPTEEERTTGHLTRFEGATAEALRILGATKQGWDRAAPEDAGVEPGIVSDLGNGLHVSVSLEPGIWAGNATQSQKQTLRSVLISPQAQQWWYDEREPAVDLDPVTVSEILVRLDRLTGAA